MDNSIFNRLPVELQLQIAFFVSCQNVPYLKISWDLSSFRLVCQQFAQLGAQIIAREPLLHRRSTYRGINIDFTPHNLIVLEALTKNHTLASAIRNVYLLKWNVPDLGGMSDLCKDKPMVPRDGPMSKTDLLTEKVMARQMFYKNPKLFPRLVAAIEALPNEPKMKWVECPFRYRERDPLIYERRQQVPESAYIEDAGDAKADDQQKDCFKLLIEQCTLYNSITSSLCVLMSRITHLHFRPQYVKDDNWDGGEKNYELWEKLLQAAKNVTCFQFESSKVGIPELGPIWKDVTWPRLRKLYFIGTWRNPDCEMIKPFLLRHRETLVSVRLPSVLHSANYPGCALVGSYMRANMRPDIDLVYMMRPEDTSEPWETCRM